LLLINGADTPMVTWITLCLSLVFSHHVDCLSVASIHVDIEMSKLIIF